MTFGRTNASTTATVAAADASSPSNVGAAVARARASHSRRSHSESSAVGCSPSCERTLTTVAPAKSGARRSATMPRAKSSKRMARAEVSTRAPRADEARVWKASPGSGVDRPLEAREAAGDVEPHARVAHRHRRHREARQLALLGQRRVVLLDVEIERRHHALARDVAGVVAE